MQNVSISHAAALCVGLGDSSHSSIVGRGSPWWTAGQFWGELGVAETASQDDQRKVADLMSAYPGDQCVVQTLHDTSPLPLGGSTTPVTATSTTAQVSPSSGGSQHQNIRDMDIIHVRSWPNKSSLLLGPARNTCPTSPFFLENMATCP